jgi:hypothetical protein
MPNAKIIVTLALAALLLACHKQEQPPANQNIAIDEGLPANQVGGNADIETLPADESSTTPSNQLANGFDSPDVNDIATSNSQ